MSKVEQITLNNLWPVLKSHRFRSSCDFSILFSYIDAQICPLLLHLSGTSPQLDLLPAQVIEYIFCDDPIVSTAHCATQQNNLLPPAYFMFRFGSVFPKAKEKKHEEIRSKAAQ